MLAATGRPRKACGRCKGLKIRCTGERPSCKRCSRLNHTCIYVDPTNARSNAKRAEQKLRALHSDRQNPNSEIFRYGHEPVSAPSFLRSIREEHFLGIPKSLVLTLVDVYFSNVYNADLLLHKPTFLQSLTRGASSPHVVLSVCAWGANFYRDATGQATLADHGFMIEWAQRAGSLVLQEAEGLYEDNIVTFCNLTLFWHSQGSWRISQLHKGNSCTTLRIVGVGSDTARMENSLESEIKRRRLWACYLTHCQNCERITLFEPTDDIANLPLPWPDGEFAAGSSKHPQLSLQSTQSNGGTFAELIKVITLWASVLELIKAPENSLSNRVASIHELDEKLSAWWRNLTPDLKLTPSSIGSLPPNTLSRILLINIVYHHSLCALHASIVPLFCWDPADDSWLSARQVSAQVAFEHACATSTLLEAVLSRFPSISSLPGFIAYAAYCGCAIQIPFMWCSNPTVKKQSQENVKTNIKIIDTIAQYFKFAALLKIHVRCIYKIHARHPTILENEPKYIDIKELTRFKMNSTNARSSILEYIGVLSKRDGMIKPGEEDALRIEEDSTRTESDGQVPASDGHEDHGSLPNHSQNICQSTHLCSHPPTPASYNQEEQHRLDESSLPSPVDLPCQPEASLDSRGLDILQPFFESEMLDLFPHGDLPDLGQFDLSPLNLDYFEISGSENPSGIDMTRKEGTDVGGAGSLYVGSSQSAGLGRHDTG
ncbi:hypothetical protein F5884DRAFT_857574 [Xylogone sp. PMI_703]|nr:hypothetical protein F5884DRAFT_857574 [Xylogone sp. PMI_703]